MKNQLSVLPFYSDEYVDNDEDDFESVMTVHQQPFAPRRLTTLLNYT